MPENTTSMPRATRARLIAGAIGALATSALLLGITTPASAGEVIASETVATAAPAGAPTTNVPMAVASKPRAITVSNQRGKSVVLFAKGEQIRRSLAPGNAPVTFTGLTAGRVYTVSVGGAPIGTVVALDTPASASGLRVSTTDRPGTVALEWSHKATRATGGADTQYVVAATSATAKAVTATVTGVRTAELAGLDPQALYSFSVTPRNTAGVGKSTKASMTRTLAQLTGTPSKSADTPVVAQPRPTETTPTPAAAPAPAPGPSTRTIWVCPDGYREVAGQCQTTQAYTFHTETQSRAYTYTWTKTGTRRNTDNQTCGYTVDARGNPVVECWGAYDEDVYSNVKDATPAGFTDNGTAWVRDVQVKDTAPAGYADNGTEWVKTAAKVERVVPA